jgi:hypothetical protein
MIIEVLTAFTAGAIVFDTLEILHLVHVGHMAGKAGYKGGSAITHAIQQQLKKWQNPENLEQEAETPYDFKAIDDADHQDIKNKAKAYLAALKRSVGSLNKAKGHFLNVHKNLTKLFHALKTKDKRQFTSALLRFQSEFVSFKGEFKQFLSIERPPRRQLYIADLYRKGGIDEKGVIEQYNDRLNTIEDYLKSLNDIKKEILNTIEGYLESLKETKQDMTNPFNQGVDAIHNWSPTTNSSSTLSFEQLQPDVKQDRRGHEQLSEAMQMILPNNKEFAELCTYVTQLFAEFKQNDQTEQIALPFKNSPNWFSLLTEAEQIEEVGQRIFLHAMNETHHSKKEKLLIAEIFLRQPVSKQVMNQIKVDLPAYDIACGLRDWQIKKCEQLIQFLSTQMQGAALPNPDPDGLLEWIKTRKRYQRPIALFREVLVSPCCLSYFSLREAFANLKRLLTDKNIDELIQKHQDSHWGAVCEKIDTLIQLPKSFSANIFTTDIFLRSRQELATNLIADLETLKEALEDDRVLYSDRLTDSQEKQNKFAKEQEDQEHKAGVTRIKQAHRRIPAISYSSNSLSPYLHHAEKINGIEKEQQVPTVDDLSHVIYRGVDPNGVCQWKSSSQPYSQPNQLIHYFAPVQQKDSRTEAHAYAYTDCQADTLPLTHLFSSSSDLENTPRLPETIKNSFSTKTILKNPNKIPAITHRKALNGVSLKTLKQTETVFKQLQNYYVLALVRINPEYRNALPFMKQCEYIVKNFFKFGDKIAEERLLSVQIYMGDLYAVLSEERTDTNKTLNNLKENYVSRLQEAQRTDGSVLYTIMGKAIYGPISDIIMQCSEVYQKQFQLEEEKNELKEQVKILQEAIVKIKRDKTKIEVKYVKDLADQKAEFNATRAKDRAKIRTEIREDSDARLEQYKAESDAKMKKMMDLLKQQRASSSSASDAQTQKSSPICYFKC